MMKNLIIPTEAYQKIVEYWKTNRVKRKPAFKVGDYVKYKKHGWAEFKSVDGRYKVQLPWELVKVMVVDIKPSRVVLQLIGPSKELRNNQSEWKMERLDRINRALDEDVPLYNMGNIYNFEKIN
jgi:hypothetical protein